MVNIMVNTIHILMIIVIAYILYLLLGNQCQCGNGFQVGMEKFPICNKNEIYLQISGCDNKNASECETYFSGGWDDGNYNCILNENENKCKRSTNQCKTLKQCPTTYSASNTFKWLKENGIDVSNPTKLENIYLHTKGITEIPTDVSFCSFTSLREIWLNDNKLTTLPVGIFNSLNSLETLNLYNNTLTTLDKDIFNGLTSLQNLTLNDNKLTT